MSTLSTAAVIKISTLARINQNPTEEFIDKYKRELEAVLEYVSELEKVDVSGVDVFAGNRTITIDNLREDEPNQSPEYMITKQNIINNFPKKQGNLLVIPNIFA
jgi:aspartyl/glutamyl-tRNA(Asn/Gln) amidotransferase C subunit